ncbi:hypothetical protein JN086_08230 [Mycolicibacterium austroafricanum]|nr:hypothetical protein JN090_07300 [Mycolicibacterium austroafricanum]QZT69976.1 hypothetical protein JN086_08230 [Mycolicibacterium austroafricanum]
MSTVAAKLSSVSTKFQVATAATAVAAAAALTPAVIANADIALPAPAAPAMSELANIAAAPALGAASIAQQAGWVWFGPADREGAPERTTILQFNTAALIPGFIKRWFGWLGQLNFQACIFGISAVIGPYGTFSATISRGC